MDSFIYLKEYRVVVCQACKYAITAAGIEAHLTGSNHNNISIEERKRIAKEIGHIPGIISNEKELKQFQYPVATNPAIFELAVPKEDGMKCKQCGYISRDRSDIQKHCRKQHGWKNPQGRGRLRTIQKTMENELPWRTDIYCQRFFPNRAGSRWFEVARPEVELADTIHQSNVFNQIKQITIDRYKRIAQKHQEQIKAADQKQEPNLWLRRVGWDIHLANKNRVRLRASIDISNTATDPVLHEIYQSFHRVILVAQQTTSRGKVMLATLFEIHRKESGKKTRKPFDSMMEPDSYKRYIGVWVQILSYIYRTRTWNEQDRPAYQLTDKQQDVLHALIAAVQQWIEHGSDPTDQQAQEDIDRLCLQLCIVLLDHALTQSEYDSVVLSAMAVMGIREDDGWFGAENYTWRYSAVIKLARMMVVLYAYSCREKRIARRKDQGMSQQQAEKGVEGIYDYVHGMMQRFMVLVHNQNKPTPMDWIFESRTYGMKLWYTTTAEGKVGWKDKQTIEYNRIRLQMDQIRDLANGVVAEARQELMRLMIIPMDEHGDVDNSQIPVIHLDRLEDDHSNETVGHSFLDDGRNTWTVDGKWWLMERVCEDEELRQKWIRAEVRPGEQLYCAATINTYKQRIQRFLELLLVAMHMTGGQPARSSEILGLRYCNTSNGGVRNIMIHRGQVCFVTSYHKNFRNSEQVKVIYRYLPDAIGQLVVWYLWLVLPFWQHIQAVILDGTELSPFLWADEVVVQEEASQRVERRSADDELQNDELQNGSNEHALFPSPEQTVFNFDRMYRSRRWTGDRLRELLLKASVQYTGQEINVSAWRHLVIAISRQFLQGDFGDDTQSMEIDLDEFDGDDNPWDLQAGHGTHVAGMVYARLLQQDRRGTSSRREQFRQVSQKWHRFLGFSRAGVYLHTGGHTRKADVFEKEAMEVQYQRFKQMHRVNIRRKMQQLLQNEEAEFRGNQQPAIQAIMQGESPVIQIAATGGGKSLSFMLPAYAVPGGVTVVITPLVSLNDDLQRRCEELQIESVIWDAIRPQRIASIVFVTPEAAVSKGFATFINRVRLTCKLDRAVFDESHYILDCKPGFRPKILQLGRTLIQMETQLVFLTATLAPRDEEQFCQMLGIPVRDGKPVAAVFRGKTTRPNIGYRVITVNGTNKPGQQRQKKAGKTAGQHESKQETAEDDQIVQLVEDKLKIYDQESKIIIYSNRVTRAEQLGRRLGCPVYHRSVDSRDGKAQRMQQWASGYSRVIVATNALGLGVDIPDIRVVIHAGRPHQMRAYAQESGRAGRDGQASEAIIVCGEREGLYVDGSQAGSQHGGSVELDRIEINALVEGQRCRREVIDGIMDDNYERQGCVLDVEEICDVCIRQQQLQQAMDTERELEQSDGLIEDDSGIGLNESELRVRFEQQQRQRQWQAYSVNRDAEQQAIEVTKLEQELVRWAGRCAWCFACRDSEGSRGHRIEECSNTTARQVLGFAEEFIAQVQMQGSMATYSCCFLCYVPQAICQHWIAKEATIERNLDSEGGLWEMDNSNLCQFAGVIVHAFWSIMVRYGPAVREWLSAWSIQEGYLDILSDTTELLKWLGQKVEWGKVEGTRMMQVFILFFLQFDLQDE